MENKTLKLLFASIVGNILEWFDFVLYGCFAYVFMKLYFPSDNTYISSIITFSVFALGFIARPLGGFVFGFIGDRYGRKQALTYSIVLITIPTTMIGVLPTYKSIGIMAPLLLVFFRLIQGFAVSGELTGSGIFLYECAPKKLKNLYGSLIMSSTYIGLFLGTIVVACISNIFSEEQLYLFAWRIPFLLSFIMGIFAFYLRINCNESPSYLKNKKIEKKPIKICFKNFKKEMVLVFFTSSILALGIYLLIGYLPSHFQIHNQSSISETMNVGLVGLIILMILTPLMGALADKIGNAQVYIIGILAFLLLSTKLFLFINTPGIYNAIISEVIISFCLAPIAGAIISIMSEIFPTNIRYTAISISYNLSMVVFGGSAPLVITILINLYGSSSSVAYYYMVGSLFSLASIIIIKISKYRKVDNLESSMEALA